MDGKLLFLRNFLRHPLAIASPLSTSRTAAIHLAERITKKGRLVIIEYGPGTGVLAKAILSGGNFSADSLLILIETNKEFVRHLRRTLNDPRVYVFHASAERVGDILTLCGERRADYIFSSIPLSVIPAPTVARILRVTERALAVDGRFIVFLVRLKARKMLRKKFPTVHTKIEPASLPPLFVFEASKRRLKRVL
ncbi:MAG: hypothetical protein PHZ00_04555 [Candidatus Peribacteraceae bacterium]|nr:hypothetical protein [Candidatus Peribacteraceae bacterium]